VSIGGPVPGSETKFLVMAGWSDVPHLSEAVRRQMLAATPKHLRAARSAGIPVLGDGAIFPVADEAIEVDPFPIPAHWWRIAGIDFGWDHPTAAVELVHDRDADVFYVTKEYAESQEKPLVHANAIGAWGKWLPIAWPHDGNNETAAGSALKGQYSDLGLNMLAEKATHPDDGGNSVEAGLMQMLDLMTAGRWKVFKTCQKWMAEKRLYHRKDGKVVKLRDDVISASRYAYMMRRFMVQAPRSTATKPRRVGWRAA
jgi:hypothetical protein